MRIKKLLAYSLQKLNIYLKMYTPQKDNQEIYTTQRRWDNA